MAMHQIMIGGHKMPSIGLGTFAATDPDALEKALDFALEIGYRHIDTAFLYTNEDVIGRTLKKWLNSGKLTREELFITTKLPFVGTYEDKVESYLKKSLEALQLDYVDLYLIHFPIAMKSTKEGPVPDVTDHVVVWKKMEEQVDAGRTKTIGLSNFNQKQIQRIIDIARIKPANLQVNLSPYLQQPELVDFCLKNNIVVVAYSSLGSPGLPSFFAAQYRTNMVVPDILGDENLKKIAAKHNKTTAQVILRFFLQKNIVTIPKSVTPSRIKENFDIFNFSLDSEDVKSIENMDKGESGRIIDFGKMHPEWLEHPEYPFAK